MVRRVRGTGAREQSAVDRGWGLINSIKTGLIWPLLSNVWTYVIAGIIAIGSTLWLTGWHAANNWFKDYLVSAVSERLNDELTDAKGPLYKGPLYSAINNAVAKIRRSDVGEINAGAFVLDQVNSSYPLAIYVPTDKIYSVKLYYRFSNSYPTCQQAVLASPKGKPIQLDPGDHDVDLGKHLFQQVSAEAEPTVENGVTDSDPNGAHQQLNRIFS
jgi:hypothetical protein